MKSVIKNNVIKKKVKARMNERIKELQSEFNAKCDEIDNEFYDGIKEISKKLGLKIKEVWAMLRDAVLELYDELVLSREEKKVARNVMNKKKEEMADRLVDSLIPKR